MTGGQRGSAPVDPTVPLRVPGDLAAELDAFDDVVESDCDADVTMARAVALEREAGALGEVELALRARLVQADMWDRKGQTAIGARILWEVSGWAEERQHRPLLARAHLLLAKTYQHLGDMAARLEHTLRSVELLDPTTSPRIRAVHLLKLADALDWNGSFKAARERYRQAERLTEQAGDVVRQLSVLNNLAYGEYTAGEPERAWAVVERMRAVAARHGLPLNPNKVDTIARIQIALGRHAEAEQTVQVGIREYHALGFDEADALPEYLLTLALAQRCQGAIDRAQLSLDRSRALCDERGLANVRVRILQEQAELHATAGDFQRAFAAYKGFHAEAEALQSRQREAQARTRQAMFETAEARQDAERFREQARRDPLTGLHNRRYVDENLPVLIDNAHHSGTPLAVALIDLDHFKRINDTLSHDVGDQVLVAIAGLITSEVATVSAAGVVARMGGEEFLVVLPDTTVAEAARRLDGLRIVIGSHPWERITGDLPVTVSIGITATVCSDDPSQTALLAAADRDLYAAKHAGRDCVVADRNLLPGRRRFRDGGPVGEQRAGG